MSVKCDYIQIPSVHVKGKVHNISHEIKIAHM